MPVIKLLGKPQMIQAWIAPGSQQMYYAEDRNVKQCPRKQKEASPRSCRLLPIGDAGRAPETFRLHMAGLIARDSWMESSPAPPHPCVRSRNYRVHLKPLENGVTRREERGFRKANFRLTLCALPPQKLVANQPPAWLGSAGGRGGARVAELEYACLRWKLLLQLLLGKRKGKVQFWRGIALQRRGRNLLP
ncbi:hypothetical protein Y1Q_0011762 [Alligator mississippiensis]|uniref:Uncharacterized protein n=1 Tax=Alligator mississippiensis TaxID=8496 RepID=A0A151M117_ALLMI|nr:hypothetical protein Y1Q_0011762 [Alligator mississippiensis]